MAKRYREPPLRPRGFGRSTMTAAVERDGTFYKCSGVGRRRTKWKKPSQTSKAAPWAFGNALEGYPNKLPAFRFKTDAEGTKKLVRKLREHHQRRGWGTPEYDPKRVIVPKKPKGERDFWIHNRCYGSEKDDDEE